MKLPLIAAATLCLSLGACTDIDRIVGGNPAGNPNDDAYVGHPDSTYDAAANPPKANGVAQYDPYKPLPAGANPAMAPAPTVIAPAPANAPQTPRHQL